MTGEMDLSTAAQMYVEKSLRDLQEVLFEKHNAFVFWPSSKKRKNDQLDYLKHLNEQFDALVVLPKKNELPKALNELFLALVNAIPLQTPAYGSWFETVDVTKKLIRLFISELAAHDAQFYQQYAETWITQCEAHQLHVPYVQLNVIGLMNHVVLYQADAVKQYLCRLHQVDWNDVFEQVFTKKVIRDRLFDIANVLIEHAGSMDHLNAYLQKQFNSAPSIDALRSLYQAYLKGIQRKLDIYRMSYPEYTFDESSHPMRSDVALAKQRWDVIHAFVDALKA